MPKVQRIKKGSQHADGFRQTNPIAKKAVKQQMRSMGARVGKLHKAMANSGVTLIVVDKLDSRPVGGKASEAVVGKGGVLAHRPILEKLARTEPAR